MKAHERFEKFEASSDKLSKMISFGKSHNNREGLGFGGKSAKQTIFVKEGCTKNCNEASILENDLNRSKASSEVGPQSVRSSFSPAAQVSTDVRSHVHQPRYEHSSNSFVPTCHFCGKLGHIRPRCNLLRRNTQRKKMSKLNSNESLQAKLKEHMMSLKRIAERVSILKKQKSKHKKIWVKKVMLVNHLEAPLVASANHLVDSRPKPPDYP